MNRAWRFALLLTMSCLMPFAAVESLMAQTSVQLRAAPSQPSYPAGQPVAIVLTLSNSSGLPVALSQLIEANFHIVSFTRDGSPVPTGKASTSYDDGLAAAQAASLTSVAPGANLQLLWSSEPNASLGGEILRLVQSRGSEDVAILYAVGAPGTYSLSFYYQFVGATGAPGTFTGRTNTVTVTFVVQ